MKEIFLSKVSNFNECLCFNFRREVVDRSPVFQPYTSVIKRNIDAFAQKPLLHPLVNFRQGELPQPLDNTWHSESRREQEEEVLQEIKSEDIEADIEYLQEPKVEIATNPEEQNFDDFKVIISKRSNSESDSEEQKNENNKTQLSPVPLKKRPRMMEVPYGLGHAINKKERVQNLYFYVKFSVYLLAI